MPRVAKKSSASEATWRGVDVKILRDKYGLAASLHGALVAAELHTLGDVADFQNENRLLTDLPGIETGLLDSYHDAFSRFWIDHLVEAA